ncbi:MAG: PE-PPE domain-containing protein [Mycobacterium sp.]
MATLVRFLTALPVAAAVVIAPNAASVAWTPTAASVPFDPPAPPATIFEIGGAGWETLDQPVMEAILGFRYDTAGNTFVNIPWPAYLGNLGEGVKQASDDLLAQIAITSGPQVAVGMSGSTFVVNEVMRRLGNDPNPPATPQDITFVVIGDGERGLLPAIAALIGPDLPLVNYRVQPIPVTPYNVIVVKGEYDGLADWPDRPWNLLADVDAWLGSPAVENYGYIHWDSIFNSLDAVPASYITTEVNAKGGTTITYLVPTPEIPLLYPLHAMGVPQAAIDVLNSVLKPLVDLGYSRNDPTWLKNLTGADSAASVPAVSSVSELGPAVDAPTVEPPKSPAASAAVGAAPGRSTAKRVAATAAVAPAAKPAARRAATSGNSHAVTRAVANR